MFREMRRQEKALSQEEMMEVLKNEEYGILATFGENGYPYGVPVNYVYTNDAIYFHCAVEGLKLDNLKQNANVCFTLVRDMEILPSQFNTKFKSVIVFGKAVEIFKEEKKESLIAILEKFSAAYMESGRKYIEKAWDKTKVFKIEIQHLSIKGKK